MLQVAAPRLLLVALRPRSTPPRALLASLALLASCSAGGGGTPGPGSASGGNATGHAGATLTGGASSGGNAAVAGSAATAGGASGSSASGGTVSGSSGSAAQGGSGGAALSGCANADILCLTFEDIAPGSMPQAAPFQKYNCAGQSTSTDLLVEAGVGVNGSQALTTKKSLNGGCNLLADLGAHPEFWVTGDVKFSAGVPVATVHELTPFEVTATLSDDPGIRPGIRADSSCNSWQGAELNITGGGERTGCTGFKFATDTWYCLEVQVKNRAAAVEADLSIDSVKQPFHIHQEEFATVVNMDWTGAKMLRLGSRSYSANVLSPVYVDNLSVSTTRVGCGK